MHDGHSLAVEWRDYPEWHRGRLRYAIWCLPVDCPQVLERWQQARAAFGDWLHPDQRRQPHITLFVCGFPCDRARHDDDFPIERLQAQIDSLLRRAGPAFSLQIGGIASYAGAPFLTVHDPAGRLAALRELLGWHSREIRFAPYEAHLTLGLYQQRRALAGLPAALRDLPALELEVRELQFCSYQADDLAGALRIEQRIALH